jgi:uncharacterized cupin superfamily protein
MKRNQFSSEFNIRPAFGVITLFVWSVIMLVVGSVFGGGMPEKAKHIFGISQLHADPLQTQNAEIIRLDRERLAGNNLGEFSPYEPDSGDLVARGHDYFYSEDENFGIGVWESKPGKMTYVDLPYDELMVVLDGSLVMTDEHGKTEVFGVGEGLVLPKGWSGTLAVPEGGVRKIWVSYMGGIKGQQP